MEQQQAGLRGDCDANLIGEFQATATFETFLSEKDLDAALEFSLIFGGKPAEKLNVALDRPLPVFRKRLSRQPSPSTLLQPSINHAGIISSSSHRASA